VAPSTAPVNRDRRGGGTGCVPGDPGGAPAPPCSCSEQPVTGLAPGRHLLRKAIRGRGGGAESRRPRHLLARDPLRSPCRWPPEGCVGEPRCERVPEDGPPELETRASPLTPPQPGVWIPGRPDRRCYHHPWRLDPPRRAAGWLSEAANVVPRPRFVPTDSRTCPRSLLVIRRISPPLWVLAGLSNPTSPRVCAWARRCPVTLGPSCPGRALNREQGGRPIGGTPSNKESAHPQGGPPGWVAQPRRALKSEMFFAR